jgi:transcriptional regulator with XRE-family HTH domain
MFLTEDKDHSGSADTLGGRIVYAREAQELTTSQLARRLGIKTETLHDWETDRSEPRSNRLLTLAGVLNVSPTWLLTGAGEAPIDALTSCGRTRAVAKASGLLRELPRLSPWS